MGRVGNGAWGLTWAGTWGWVSKGGLANYKFK